MNFNRVFVRVCACMSAALAVVQVMLVLGSWIATVLCPSLRVRSLLGSDGMRWLFGSFVGNVLSAPLLWILLLGCAWGMLRKSRLYSAIAAFGASTAYERMALMVVAWEVLAVVLAVVALVFVPHAVLLSALGTIVPSSFSAAVLPVFVAMVCIAALTYGRITGRFKSLSDAFGALAGGLAGTAPVVIVYFFAAELFCSVVWVFTLQ